MTDRAVQAEHFTCEHAWKHTHYPGALVYWVGKCMLCGYLDVEDLNRQIRDRSWWRKIIRFIKERVVD